MNSIDYLQLSIFTGLFVLQIGSLIYALNESKEPTLSKSQLESILITSNFSNNIERENIKYS